MDVLPLPSLPPLVPFGAPFTRAMAAARGLDRRSLERLLREGHVRRLVRGAYLASGAPETREVRAAAVALVSGREVVAVDRTAAWVHGVDVLGAARTALHPVETQGAGRASVTAPGGRRRLADHDVEDMAGLRLTTAVRTATDLGRVLAPAPALGAMDRLLALGLCTHADLLAELPRFAGHRGAAQLRALVAQADARSSGPAESALRLHWHGARLPTATPGLSVTVGGRLVRLALGDPVRRFGAVLSEQLRDGDLPALAGAGWRVVVLSGARVLMGDPRLWLQHLERELHQHLMTQAG